MALLVLLSKQESGGADINDIWMVPSGSLRLSWCKREVFSVILSGIASFHATISTLRRSWWFISAFRFSSVFKQYSVEEWVFASKLASLLILSTILSLAGSVRMAMVAVFAHIYHACCLLNSHRRYQHPALHSSLAVFFDAIWDIIGGWDIVVWYVMSFEKSCSLEMDELMYVEGRMVTIGSCWCSLPLATSQKSKSTTILEAAVSFETLARQIHAYISHFCSIRLLTALGYDVRMWRETILWCRRQPRLEEQKWASDISFSPYWNSPHINIF